MTAPSDPTTHAVSRWFTAAIPDQWFEDPPSLHVDREEVLIIGRLPRPPGLDDDPRALQEACAARIEHFRGATRDQRITIAEQGQHRFGRKVSWGAACGEVEVVFTSLSVPVMTRLRLSERSVLDTLVDAGVARSRSDALAWCVRLVGAHEGDWISQLRDAFAAVERVRAAGPRLP